jgi:hypothetical protein
VISLHVRHMIGRMMSPGGIRLNLGVLHHALALIVNHCPFFQQFSAAYYWECVRIGTFKRHFRAEALSEVGVLAYLPMPTKFV